MPFPPASLSGHAKGGWRGKHEVTKSWRGWALLLARTAKWPPIPPTGDIPILVRFTPPNGRAGDRTNFGNRMKPIFDGIAQALKVNDSRFVPRYEYLPPAKPGGIVVEILTD